MEKLRKFSNDRRRLNRLLKKNGIAFKWHHLYNGYQWIFPESKYPDGDAVIHSGSYFSERGWFETMGIGPENDCIGRPAQELISLLRNAE